MARFLNRLFGSSRRRSSGRRRRDAVRLPRSYYAVRGGRAVPVSVRDRDELLQLRGELELLHQCAKGDSPQMFAALGNPTVFSDPAAADGLREVLADALNPAVRESISRIDDDFPGLERELSHDVITQEAERVRRDLVKIVAQSKLPNAPALARDYVESLRQVTASSSPPNKGVASTMKPDKNQSDAVPVDGQDSVEDALASMNDELDNLSSMIAGASGAEDAEAGEETSAAEAEAIAEEIASLEAAAGLDDAESEQAAVDESEVVDDSDVADEVSAEPAAGSDDEIDFDALAAEVGAEEQAAPDEPSDTVEAEPEDTVEEVGVADAEDIASEVLGEAESGTEEMIASAADDGEAEASAAPEAAQEDPQTELTPEEVEAAIADVVFGDEAAEEEQPNSEPGEEEEAAAAAPDVEALAETEPDAVAQELTDDVAVEEVAVEEAEAAGAVALASGADDTEDDLEGLIDDAEKALTEIEGLAGETEATESVPAPDDIVDDDSLEDESDADLDEDPVAGIDDATETDEELNPVLENDLDDLANDDVDSMVEEDAAAFQPAAEPAAVQADARQASAPPPAPASPPQPSFETRTPEAAPMPPVFQGDTGVRRTAGTRGGRRAGDAASAAMARFGEFLMDEASAVWGEAHEAADHIIAMRDSLEQRLRSVTQLEQELRQIREETLASMHEAQRLVAQIRNYRDDANRARQRAESAADSSQGACDRADSAARDAHLAADHARRR